MQDKDLVPIMAVKDTAGRLDNLTITRTPKFLRAATAVGVIRKLLNVAEDAFDKLASCDRVL